MFDPEKAMKSNSSCVLLTLFEYLLHNNFRRPYSLKIRQYDSEQEKYQKRYLEDRDNKYFQKSEDKQAENKYDIQLST